MSLVELAGPIDVVSRILAAAFLSAVVAAIFSPRFRLLLRGYARMHTGEPIGIAVLLGFVLLEVVLSTYAELCAGGAPYVRSFTCKMIRENPPWTLLTALMAGPPALFTWYWRTMHKKDDIDHARAAEINARFASAVGLLKDGQAGAIYVLEGVARDAPKEYHWPVVETLAAAVRGWYGEDIEVTQVPKVMKQALVTALGRRKRQYDEGRVIELPGTNLSKLDFRGLNFDRANFENANLDGANLTAGASFLQAKFPNAKASGAIADGSTVLNDLGVQELVVAGVAVNSPERVEVAMREIARLRNRRRRPKGDESGPDGDPDAS